MALPRKIREEINNTAKLENELAASRDREKKLVDRSCGYLSEIASLREKCNTLSGENQRLKNTVADLIKGSVILRTEVGSLKSKLKSSSTKKRKAPASRKQKSAPRLQSLVSCVEDVYL